MIFLLGFVDYIDRFLLFGSTQVAVPKLVRLWILRRLHARDLTDLIGRHDLVAGKLIGDFSKGVDRYKPERIRKVFDRLLLGPGSFGEKLSVSTP